MDYSIFKTYDIRGIYPNQFDEETAYKLGRAYATWLKNKNFAIDPPVDQHEALRVVVGSDMRVSSPALKAQLLAGLLDSGINVDDVGLVSTPTFYFAAAFYGYDGGVQVSASHNPKEYNGLKIVTRGGLPVSENSGLLEIKKIIEEEAYCPVATVQGILSVKSGVVEEEANEQLKNLPLDKIKPFKVVVDAGNGMGSLDMAALFEHLPQCQMVKMNFDLDGNFPSHGADPMKPENTADLCKRVVAEQANLGIAPDGDADRYFFVDEKGQVIPQEILRGLMAQYELRENPGALVVYDIRPGRATQDLIDEVQGRAEITPIGHSIIKEQMIRDGAIFGAESSGHYFFKLPYGTFEAGIIFAVKFLLMASEAAEQGKTLSELVAPYKKYFHSGETNFRLESREKAVAMIEAIKQKYADGKQTLLDGVFVEYPDFWFLVRASNTEPLIRLSVEARSKELLDEKFAELKSLLE